MEDLIPILVFIAFAVLSLLGRLAKKSQQTGGGAHPSTLDRMLREMMQQAGIEPEPPVLAEHRPTRSEHRASPAEHRQAAAETYATASEHLPTRTEVRPTPSEHRPRVSEHLPTPGEHLKGDVPLDLPPIPVIRPVKKRKRSTFANAVVADLTGGAGTLGRAIVLRDILGSPVSLRPPGEQS